MKFSYLLQLLTIVVSVISIFISNTLGRISETKHFQRDQKLKRYNSLYVPLIKSMYNILPENLDYFNLRRLNLIYQLTDIISDNFEYIGATSAPLLSRFMIIGEKAYSDWTTANYSMLSGIVPLKDSTEELTKANFAFNRLIENLLSESSQLSQDLRLEDISKPILNSFLNAPNHKL